jgi:hypothetical protein
MGLWSYIKSYFVSQEEVENKFANPYCLLRYDIIHHVVRIEVGWPQETDKNIIIEGFSKVLIALQSGQMGRTFEDAILNRGQNSNDMPTSMALLDSIRQKTEKMITQSQPKDEFDDIMMYPGQVFAKD